MKPMAWQISCSSAPKESTAEISLKRKNTSPNKGTNSQGRSSSHDHRCCRYRRRNGHKKRKRRPYPTPPPKQRLSDSPIWGNGGKRSPHGCHHPRHHSVHPNWIHQSQIQGITTGLLKHHITPQWSEGIHTYSSEITKNVYKLTNMGLTTDYSVLVHHFKFNLEKFSQTPQGASFAKLLENWDKSYEYNYKYTYIQFDQLITTVTTANNKRIQAPGYNMADDIIDGRITEIPPPPLGPQWTGDVQKWILCRRQIFPRHWRLPTCGYRNSTTQHQQLWRYHLHHDKISSGPSHGSKGHNQKETRDPKKETHNTGSDMKTLPPSRTSVCSKGHQGEKIFYEPKQKWRQSTLGHNETQKPQQWYQSRQMTARGIE